MAILFVLYFMIILFLNFALLFFENKRFLSTIDSIPNNYQAGLRNSKA